MKKHFLFLTMALLLVAVALPANGQNATIDPNRNALVVDGEPTIGVQSTAGDDCAGGYTHADGTLENGYRFAANPLSTHVEQFTAPAGNDWVMTTICICWSSLGGAASANYELVVFDDDGVGGIPGTEIMAVADTAITVPAFSNSEWYSTGVTLAVPAGETFYIGTRWDGTQDAFFCADESAGTTQQIGYRSPDGGTTWEAMPNATHANYRAYFIAFQLEADVEPEPEIPAVNFPNKGEILISAGAPVLTYAAAGNYPTGIVLPADYDGNGFDTYTITSSATVAGETWYAVWVGGEDYLWVPASQVTVLR